MSDPRKPPLEKDIHRAVAQFYKLCGCHVYNLAQGYRPGGKRHGSTRQTEGLADLYVLWPARGVAWWHEVKRPGKYGVISPAQSDFDRLNGLCGVTVVTGGLGEARSQVDRVRGIGPPRPPESP